jgi:hypothetical protein
MKFAHVLLSIHYSFFSTTRTLQEQVSSFYIEGYVPNHGTDTPFNCLLPDTEFPREANGDESLKVFHRCESIISFY